MAYCPPKQRRREPRRNERRGIAARIIERDPGVSEDRALAIARGINRRARARAIRRVEQQD